MIPKQIFFIWLGDQKPAYVDFSAKAFSDVNQAFRIDVMHWKVSEIEDPKDRLLKNAVTYAHEHRQEGKPFIQTVADVYRHVLLGEYGGIYLDSDTFPIRPFPDDLLERPFVVTRSYNNDWKLFKEIFFIGREKGGSPEDVRLLSPHNSPFTGEFLDLRRKFFSCTLKYGERFGNPKENFIDHYNDYRWNKDACRVQLCRYDRMPPPKFEEFYLVLTVFGHIGSYSTSKYRKSRIFHEEIFKKNDQRSDSVLGEAA